MDNRLQEYIDYLKEQTEEDDLNLVNLITNTDLYQSLKTLKLEDTFIKELLNIDDEELKELETISANDEEAAQSFLDEKENIIRILIEEDIDPISKIFNETPELVFERLFDAYMDDLFDTIDETLKEKSQEIIETLYEDEKISLKKISKAFNIPIEELKQLLGLEGKIINVAFMGYPDEIATYYLPFFDQLKDKYRVKTIWRYPDYSYTEKIPYREDIYYTEYIEDILQDEEIDLVIINRRGVYNDDYALDVIDSGKNLIIEIPLSVFKKDIKYLYKLAKEKGVFLAPYYNKRYDSDFLTVKKVIESGKLGEIFEIQSNYDFYDINKARFHEFFQIEKGLAFSVAWHLYDQIIELLGNPTYINGEASTFIDDYTMNDFFRINIAYEDLTIEYESEKPHWRGRTLAGINGNLFSVKPRPRFVVIGERGTFIKETGDRQKEDLENFVSPADPNFGLDRPEDYGTLYYVDEITIENEDDHIDPLKGKEIYHEEKIVSEIGNYGKFFEDIYDALIEKKPFIKKKEVIEAFKSINTFIDFNDYDN